MHLHWRFYQEKNPDLYLIYLWLSHSLLSYTNVYSNNLDYWVLSMYETLRHRYKSYLPMLVRFLAGTSYQVVG